jgi:hypothetical protein
MKMLDSINTAYVQVILDDMSKQSKSLSRDDFYALCRRDISIGVEVDEAARRFFARKRWPQAQAR